MSLVPDYEDSSEDSEEEDDARPKKTSTKFSHTKNRSASKNFSNSDEKTAPSSETNPSKLPTPGFLNNDEGRKNLLKTSVFTNPFIEAEMAKKAILEKHVKMVNTNDTAATINGKKVCWNYRKGRCRFGHNCKYAHDSDLQKTKEELEVQNQIQQTVICQSRDLPQPTSQELNQIKEESVTGKQKRKRPGLTQGLVPGKKVMKKYLNQQKQ